VGSELLAAGSVLAAFLAGGVALFAPCCIVFLAPSYLAGAVKSARWRLLPLTFVFAGGLAVVMVPLTLGASLLSGAIARYHQPLYYAGGVLFFVLAWLALSGRMWSLPSALRAPDTTKGDSASFFALGVFSGIASSCCAPVLVGVMTLSALSGSVAGGLTLGLAYVFGMVFPLFVMALIWDRVRLGERKWLRPRAVRFTIAGHRFVTTTLNVAVAIGFAVMGGFVVARANDSTMNGGSGLQVSAARGLTRFFLRLEGWLAPLPEVLLGLGLLAVALGFVWFTLADRRRRPGAPADAAAEHPSPAPEDEAPSCHGPAAGTPHEHQQHEQNRTAR